MLHPATLFLMESSLLDALRHDLEAAAFTESAVSALLTDDAVQLLHQGSSAAARSQLALHTPTPLIHLLSLFIIGDAVEEEVVQEAFPRLGVHAAVRLTLITQENSGRFRAALSLTPFTARSRSHEDRTLWVMSDLDDHLRPDAAAHDHVMGIGGATRTLARQIPTLDENVSVLDLGTGSGILALICAAQGTQVTATDLSSRALTFAQANARLNQLTAIDFRQGNLFEPVINERFDLIVSNPPFVIAPVGEDAAPEYRSSVESGDALMQRVVQTTAHHLAAGGEAIFLGNWEVHWGQDVFARVREWIKSSDYSSHIAGAWVVARDGLTPMRYAQTWTRDGGVIPGTVEHERAMTLAVDDFRSRRVTQVMLGWFRVRARSEAVMNSVPVIHTEESLGAIATSDAQIFGDLLRESMNTGLTAACATDEMVRKALLTRSPAVREVREYVPGNEDPSKIWLAVDYPIARTISVDTATAAVVGASDGELTVAQLSNGLANIFGGDADDYAAQLVDVIRELAWCAVFTEIEFASAD